MKHEIIIPEHWKNDLVTAESIIEHIFQECESEDYEVELHELLITLRGIIASIEYNNEFDTVFVEEYEDYEEDPEDKAEEFYIRKMLLGHSVKDLDKRYDD